MIQSIDRAAKILALLQGSRRLGITDLAGALDLPVSTAHGLVKSLQAHGLVAQERTGNRYVLGPALVKLSSVYLDTLDVRARSLRWMHDLSGKTGLASRLGVELGTEVLVIHHVPRPDGTEQMPETGASLPSHASALGKVLLAFDPDYAQEVLQGPLRTLTGSTITAPPALEEQFADIRHSGIGWEIEEAVLSENAVAAPIYDASGDVIAALALVVPENEWPPNDSAVQELRTAARSISRELGAPFIPTTTSA